MSYLLTTGQPNLPNSLYERNFDNDIKSIKARPHVHTHKLYVSSFQPFLIE